jgi:competence ComEA-like helix-hairpin-helix protein
VIVVMAVILLIGGWRLLWNRERIASPAPDVAPRADELVSQLDPNVATEAELSVLPLFGPRRARAVVEFREKSGKTRPFEKLDDLKQVKGIGDGVINQIAPYVTFESRPAEMQK